MFCPCLIFLFVCLLVSTNYRKKILTIENYTFQLAISSEGDAAAVGLAIVNTILGGATGGMSVLFINYKINGKWSYLQTLNGALAGKSYTLQLCTPNLSIDLDFWLVQCLA